MLSVASWKVEEQGLGETKMRSKRLCGESWGEEKMGRQRKKLGRQRKKIVRGRWANNIISAVTPTTTDKFIEKGAETFTS